MEFVPGEGFSSCETQHLELELFVTRDMGVPSSSGGGGSGCGEEREHMFEKVVTPSDVGKLNRLVIPKQHAEKYFPLDPTNSDKGLFLNFQDSSGKSWRFRYSYWTSSQSYVMTKGWSRFVKDKKLDAGDTVSFLRSKLDSSSLFIDWRRTPIPHHHHLHHHHRPSSSSPWTPLLLPTPNPHHSHHYWMSHPPNYDNYLFRNHHIHNHSHPGSMIFDQSNSGSGSSSSSRRWIDPSTVLESVPVGQGKKLRLFGVNMEMDTSSQPDCDDPASYGRSLQQQPNNNDNEEGKPSSNSHSNMSLDFHM